VYATPSMRTIFEASSTRPHVRQMPTSERTLTGSSSR
jgi:hypothetical protein